jgi:hypothetical protein
VGDSRFEASSKSEWTCSVADHAHDPRDPHEPDEAALAVVARHALHDEELIAAYAAGATESRVEATKARALVERCATCRDLHADLVGIGAALALDFRGTTTAPRDFRLSADDARRLGGRVLVPGFLTRLRRSMDSFARPVGASMATLGVVGLLVGSVTLGGAPASAPIAMDTTQAATSAPAASSIPAAAGSEGGTSEGDPGKSIDGTAAFGPLQTASEGETDGEGPRETVLAAKGMSPATLLFGGSLALLIAGIALLVLSLRRRRPR